MLAFGIAKQFAAGRPFPDVSAKLGANGYGKSTFRKILGGKVEASAGSAAIEFK